MTLYLDVLNTHHRMSTAHKIALNPHEQQLTNPKPIKYEQYQVTWWEKPYPNKI